jgi:hypothetical protein
MRRRITDALDECDNPSKFLEALKNLSAAFRDKRVSVDVFISSWEDVQFTTNATLSDRLAIKITPTATRPDLL